jgi:Rod binding domain-containing protein
MNDLLGADITSLSLSPMERKPGGKLEKDTPESVAKAASQFEALLIGQLLKSAREAGGESWMGTDPSDADSSLMEMSEQQLASTLASNGGLGLAKMVKEGLSRSVDKAHSTAVK